MMEIKITYGEIIKGVDIESKDDFYYSNIKNMYKSGNGFGLQTNHPEIEAEIRDLCHKIADLIYKAKESGVSDFA